MAEVVKYVLTKAYSNGTHYYPKGHEVEIIMVIGKTHYRIEIDGYYLVLPQWQVEVIS